MTRSRSCSRWRAKLPAVLTCLATVAGHSAGAAPATAELQKQVRVATFEVVMRKPEQDALSYEKPLPLELMPFTERNDKYWSVGTAFAIGPDTYVSAGHVMASGVGSQFGTPSLRGADGTVYPVDRVLKFSLHEDFMVFSVAKAPAVTALETTSTRAIDDPVFAVGNALGDGVVIRDGLLTSMTPEDQDGRWKWLRFSAAASPGNSGGPLLDTQGRVIGIVIARSPGENLNFALPIERVTADPGKAATFDIRESFQLPMLKKTQVANFKDSFDLPQPYSEFARRYLTSRLRYYKGERDRLLADQAEQLFPRGESAKLLAMDKRPETPALVTQKDDHSWEANTGQKNDVTDLPGDGRVALHFVNGTGLFELQRPDAASDDAFYADSRASMDMLLKGMKVTRPVGPQAIRVTSAGAAQRDTPFVDRFGRKWQLRSWPMGFMDMEMLTLWLPVPNGYVGILRFAPSSTRELVAEELQLLANYFQAPYSGTLPQWRAFLDRRTLRPAVFDHIRISHDAVKGMHYESLRLKVAVPTDMLKISDDSPLKLDMVYLMDGDTLTWDVGAITLSKKSDGETYVAAYRQPRPAKEAGKDLLQRWEHMAKRDEEFDGSVGHDSDFKVFWVQSSASMTQAGQGAVDPTAGVLYELLYRTNEKVLPRDLEYRRARLSEGFQILER